MAEFVISSRFGCSNGKSSTFHVIPAFLANAGTMVPAI
jgi:hypothetical protein